MNEKDNLEFKGTKYTLYIFHHFYMGDNFCVSCLSFLHIFPSEKCSTLKGKNLLQTWSNSFLLEKILFKKGNKNILTMASLGCVMMFPLNISKRHKKHFLILRPIWFLLSYRQMPVVDTSIRPMGRCRALPSRSSIHPTRIVSGRLQPRNSTESPWILHTSTWKEIM